MTDIDNALVLVTGATGGFGAQMVEQFLAAGSRLVVTDRDAARVDALASKDAGIVASVTADLSQKSGCTTVFETLRDAGLVPDILINNAGIAVAGRQDHVPHDRWETLLAINLTAPILLTSLILPQMIERRSGHIVNISSLAGWVGSPNLATYCASKFGLRGFADALRYDVAEDGIQVSTVYPAFSRTPILNSEQFGFAARREVPDDMLSDPANVVANIIQGIRRNRPHIFPDRTSRVTHYLVRYLPAIIPLLQRRLERATRQTGG